MKALRTIFTLSLLLVLAGSIAQAAITTTGYVSPSDPLAWTTSTTANIGSGSADGTLTIDTTTDGSTVDIVANAAYVGYNNDSAYEGILTISGSNTTWTNGETFYNGIGGHGELYVTDGAELNIGQAQEANSRFGVGFNNSGSTKTANGYMEIRNGGKVTNSYIAYIGYRTGATGSVLVTDSGSSWISSHSISISDGGGNGSLTVENGGYVKAEGWFDMGNDGSITVDGPGSVIESPVVYVTYLTTNASLNVSNSGVVNTEYILSSWYGGSGNINLNNGTINTTNLGIVADDLTGTGTINTHGIVTEGNIVFDSAASLTQTVTGIGGSNVDIVLDIDGTAWLGAGTAGVGSLTISNGVNLTSSRGYLGRLASANGTATVSGIGSTWTISDEYDSGTLYVGLDGKGTLNITDGGLVSAAGGVTIDNDEGDTPSSSIKMSTGGMLAFFSDADSNGTGDDLSGSISAFLNAIGGDGTINWWNESISDWAPLDSATLGTDCTLEYLTTGDLAGYTQLTVGTARVAGDANSDGKVDGSDVTILAGNWQAGVVGGGATWDMGDFNGDGKVDGSDVTILAGNWQYGVSAAASAVPEPGTLALLLTALLAVGFVRKVKK